MDQWANKLGYNAESNYNYNDYKDYKDTTWKCDHLSSAELITRKPVHFCLADTKSLCDDMHIFYVYTHLYAHM